MRGRLHAGVSGLKPLLVLGLVQWGLAAFAAAPGMVLEAAIDRGCFISENKKKIDPKQAAAAEKNAALLSEALGNSRAASPESPVGQTKAAKKIAESKMQPSMPARNEGMHR